MGNAAMNIHDNGAVFSSDRMNWETPQWLFDELNDEFHFALDVAANVENNRIIHGAVPKFEDYRG